MNDEQTPALRQAVENMATMREAYDNLSQAAEAYNVGKTQLAQAITSKGVETSPTETYPEMAEKVNAISQETYEINGGEMYAKQLFGSLETPNYWNLYDVLAQLLSDGRLVNYGGILLAEYYRGYDGIDLTGADTGGAYVVSDLDENGQFKKYDIATRHTWDTEFDGKGNRWVAYCFADEYHDFRITDTNTSPRSIFIGKKVGTITSLVDGRVSQIVVPDGNELKAFNTGEYTQNHGKIIVLRNIEESNGKLIYNSPNTELLYVDIGKLNGGIIFAGVNSSQLSNYIIKCKSVDTNTSLLRNVLNYSNSGYTQLKEIFIIGIETSSAFLRLQDQDGSGIYVPNLQCIYILNSEEVKFLFTVSNNSTYIGSLTKMVLGYKDGVNDKTKSFSISGIGQYSYHHTPPNLTCVELRDGWCKPVQLSDLRNLTEENMYAYILQRLKQDEPDCGDGVTITLGSTNLAKLTSEESQDLLAELQGTYGYTFQ